MFVGTPRSRSEEEQILPLSRFFFVFSCTLCIRYPYFVLCLGCPAFCLLCFTYNTQHKHPCPWRDSNPQIQQAIGGRPSP